MHREEFITYNGCFRALSLIILRTLLRKAALDVISNHRNYREQINKLNETRQGNKKIQNVKYSIRQLIQSLQQIRVILKKGNRKTVIKSYNNLIQGTVLDLILI